jgi:hypothetical protein
MYGGRSWGYVLTAWAPSVTSWCHLRFDVSMGESAVVQGNRGGVGGPTPRPPGGGTHPKPRRRALPAASYTYSRQANGEPSTDPGL